jgi:hypothetical protein
MNFIFEAFQGKQSYINVFLYLNALPLLFVWSLGMYFGYFSHSVDENFIQSILSDVDTIHMVWNFLIGFALIQATRSLETASLKVIGVGYALLNIIPGCLTIYTLVVGTFMIYS